MTYGRADIIGSSGSDSVAATCKSSSVTTCTLFSCSYLNSPNNRRDNGSRQSTLLAFSQNVAILYLIHMYYFQNSGGL
jgi:hypothetical protein